MYSADYTSSTCCENNFRESASVMLIRLCFHLYLCPHATEKDLNFKIRWRISCIFTSPSSWCVIYLLSLSKMNPESLATQSYCSVACRFKNGRWVVQTEPPEPLSERLTNQCPALCYDPFGASTAQFEPQQNRYQNRHPWNNAGASGEAAEPCGADTKWAVGKDAL